MDLSPYVGIPFVPRGRDREGLDCYGLVWLVFRDEMGIVLPRYEGACELGRAPDEIGSRIAENLGDWTEVPATELRPMDVVFVRSFGFNHVGIYLGGSKMIHMSKGGVVVEDLRRPGKGRIEACFRHRSLAA